MFVTSIFSFFHAVVKWPSLQGQLNMGLFGKMTPFQNNYIFFYANLWTIIVHRKYSKPVNLVISRSETLPNDILRTLYCLVRNSLKQYFLITVAMLFMEMKKKKDRRFVKSFSFTPNDHRKYQKPENVAKFRVQELSPSSLFWDHLSTIDNRK